MKGPKVKFYRKQFSLLSAHAGLPQLTCLMLRVAGQLDDQRLVVFLGVGELGLYLALVIVTEHL